MAHIFYAYACGKAATPLYYVVVMLQLTVITPWLLKNRRIWMYLITPGYLILIYGYNIVVGSVPRLYETFFPAWFFFYIFGMDCRGGRFNGIIRNIKGHHIIIALFISIVEAYILKAVGGADGFITSQIRFGSFLYTTVICLWLQKNKKDITRNILSRLGDYSYGIFYCHMLVLLVVRKVVHIIGLDKIWIINLCLCFLITAVGTVIIIVAVRHILTKLKCKKILPFIGF